jgi:hypothetical protein
VRRGLPSLRHPDEPLADFRHISRAGRFDVSQVTLSAADSQQEALLIPMEDNRFGICVDPTPPGGWRRVRPSVRGELRRHRFRFRVAHEIAHSFFYDRTTATPQRTLPSSEAEELFCDEFARSLLIPPRVARKCAPTPGSVFSLHREYDVSVEVAARALASEHRGARVALWYEASGEGWLPQWTNAKGRRHPDIRRELNLAIDHGRGQAVGVRQPRRKSSSRT